MDEEQNLLQTLTVGKNDSLQDRSWGTFKLMEGKMVPMHFCP